jgi:hypothetical protein
MFQLAGNCTIAAICGCSILGAFYGSRRAHRGPSPTRASQPSPARGPPAAVGSRDGYGRGFRGHGDDIRRPMPQSYHAPPSVSHNARAISDGSRPPRPVIFHKIAERNPKVQFMSDGRFQKNLCMAPAASQGARPLTKSRNRPDR